MSVNSINTNIIAVVWLILCKNIYQNRCISILQFLFFVLNTQNKQGCKTKKINKFIKINASNSHIQCHSYSIWHRVQKI